MLSQHTQGSFFNYDDRQVGGTRNVNNMPIVPYNSKGIISQMSTCWSIRGKIWSTQSKNDPLENKGQRYLFKRLAEQMNFWPRKKETALFENMHLVQCICTAYVLHSNIMHMSPSFSYQPWFSIRPFFLQCQFSKNLIQYIVILLIDFRFPNQFKTI